MRVLVALDEADIAKDAQERAAIQAQALRIEYARSYAGEVELAARVNMMERLKATFEQRNTLHRI